VAGAAAANGLLGGPLNEIQLLEACLIAENSVAGRHLDNIAPSLLGGIVLVRTLDPIDVVRLPVPNRLRVVIAHPDQQLKTSVARALLPAQVSLETTIRQMANVASIVAACFNEDLALMGRALHDCLAEPVRAPHLPGFDEAKAAALEAGALGAAISGAGPTAFALCDSDVAAQRVSHAMRDAYATLDIVSTVRVTRLDQRGVRLEHEVVSAL
jgi:homoserine kinase